jgi:hypothetical protein
MLALKGQRSPVFVNVPSPKTSFPRRREPKQAAVFTAISNVLRGGKIARARGIEDDWWSFLDACVGLHLRGDDGRGSSDFG